MIDRIKLFSSFIHRHKIYQEKEVCLKSGQNSNFYYNFRELSDAGSFIFLSKLISNLLEEMSLSNNIDCFFTNAYGGIMITTSVLLYLNNENIKMGYIRKEKKDHGDKRDIIGHLPEQNENVILVDDVFSTGKSVLEMYEYLKDTGCHIKAVLVLINRSDGEIVRSVSERIGVPIYWISTHDEVMASRAKNIF